MSDLVVEYIVHVESGKYNPANAAIAFTDEGGYGAWGYYPAPYIYEFMEGSVTLFSYTCEGEAEKEITTEAELSKLIGLSGQNNGALYDNRLIYPVKLPPGCKKLRLYYNSEGGALLFVSARFIDTKDAIRPEPGSPTPIDGTNAAFPLLKAVVDEEGPAESTIPAAAFAWNADADATTNPAVVPGCWTTTALPPGSLSLHAKPTLTAGKAQYSFSHWEYRTRSPSFDPPDVTDETYGLVYYLETSQIFAYVIAWYKTYTIGPVVWGGQTKPGDISIGDPAPKIFAAIRRFFLRLFGVRER